MKKIFLQSVVWKEGKHYVSQCLNVDIASFGKTKKEAVANLTEALELYFEDVPKVSALQKVSNPEVLSLNLQYT